MTLVWYAQWAGCAFGVCGAFMLALNNSLSGWGFVSFLVSNVCWILFGVLTNATGLIFMQVLFTATSLLGIYRWIFVRPGGKPLENRRRLVDCIYNPREFRARKFRAEAE